MIKHFRPRVCGIMQLCVRFLFAQIPAMSVQIDKYDHNERRIKMPKVQPMNMVPASSRRSSKVKWGVM